MSEVNGEQRYGLGLGWRLSGDLQWSLQRGRLWRLGNLVSDLRYWTWRALGSKP